MSISPVNPLPSGLQHDLDAAVLLVAEHLVAVGRVVERQPVRDDERRVDLALLDPLQQRLHVPVDVGLAHLEGQALVERGAERELVEQPAVDAGDRDRAALAAALDRLAQRVRPVGRQHQAALALS